MIRLSRPKFRRWLERHQGVIVGIAKEPRKCPICRYLKSQGAKRVYIDVPWRLVDGGYHKHSKWQQEFQYAAMKLERELEVVGLRGREAMAVLDGLA